MSKQVFCSKLNQEAESLEKPPIPGALGEKIFQHISKKAWGLWMNQQTMLINEYRLNLMDAKSREFLRTEMEKFLFQGQDSKPAGFTEEKN